MGVNRMLFISIITFYRIRSADVANPLDTSSFVTSFDLKDYADLLEKEDLELEDLHLEEQYFKFSSSNEEESKEWVRIEKSETDDFFIPFKLQNVLDYNSIYSKESVHKQYIDIASEFYRNSGFYVIPRLNEWLKRQTFRYNLSNSRKFEIKGSHMVDFFGIFLSELKQQNIYYEKNSSFSYMIINFLRRKQHVKSSMIFLFHLHQCFCGKGEGKLTFKDLIHNFEHLVCEFKKNQEMERKDPEVEFTLYFTLDRDTIQNFDSFDGEDKIIEADFSIQNE